MSSEEGRIQKPANRRTVALFIGVLGVILGPPIVALFALTLLLVGVVDYVGAAVYLAIVLLLLR